MAKGPSRTIAWDFRTPSFTILSDHQDDLGITHDRFCDLRTPEFNSSYEKLYESCLRAV